MTYFQYRVASPCDGRPWVSINRVILTGVERNTVTVAGERYRAVPENLADVIKADG